MAVSKEQILAALAKVPSPGGAALTDARVLSDIVVTDSKVFFSLTVDAAAVKAWEPARDAAEAAVVERERAFRPDVVLCDIGLPGMSGYEVAKALREAGTLAQLIAVSGYAQPEDVKRAIEAGFDGHVAKPCDPEKIERLLG